MEVRVVLQALSKDDDAACVLITLLNTMRSLPVTTKASNQSDLPVALTSIRHHATAGVRQAVHSLRASLGLNVAQQSARPAVASTAAQHVPPIKAEVQDALVSRSVADWADETYLASLPKEAVCL
jgi:hypothetical protein